MQQWISSHVLTEKHLTSRNSDVRSVCPGQISVLRPSSLWSCTPVGAEHQGGRVSAQGAGTQGCGVLLLPPCLTPSSRLQGSDQSQPFRRPGDRHHAPLWMLQVEMLRLRETKTCQNHQARQSMGERGHGECRCQSLSSWTIEPGSGCHGVSWHLSIGKGGDVLPSFWEAVPFA